MNHKEAQRTARAVSHMGMVDAQVRDWAQLSRNGRHELHSYDVVARDPLTGYSRTYSQPCTLRELRAGEAARRQEMADANAYYDGLAARDKAAAAG